jgi:hypothetical protein
VQRLNGLVEKGQLVLRHQFLLSSIIIFWLRR